MVGLFRRKNSKISLPFIKFLLIHKIILTDVNNLRPSTINQISLFSEIHFVLSKASIYQIVLIQVKLNNKVIFVLS